MVDDDEVMLITDGGKVLRARVSGISTMGRATQGVRIMNLGAGEKLVAMARLAESDVAEGDGESGSELSRSQDGGWLHGDRALANGDSNAPRR